MKVLIFSIRRIGAGLGMAVLVVLSAASARAVPPFYFEDFERSSGWTPGPLEQEESAVQLIEGEAAIEERVETGSRQFLRVGPSVEGPTVRIMAGPLAAEPELYAEILVRPFALPGEGDEEFLDLDGAVLGCFRIEGQAEICALFDTPEEGEGAWISTGLRFKLDAEGRTEEWIKVRIRFDRATRRWDLFLNDEPVLAGLRAVTVPEPGPPALWLYGHAEAGCAFDDLLLAPIPPDRLESELGEERRAASARTRAVERRYPQIVRRTQSTETLRSAAGQVAALIGSPPAMNGWRISLDTGNRKYEGDPTGASDAGTRIIAYSPGYDEAGNRLPTVITITADAKIAPGTDLSRLRWRISELIGYPDKFGEVVGEGDFRSGLVQTFTLSSEWTQKATSVSVWVTE